jgi:hypothetical protein
MCRKVFLVIVLTFSAFVGAGQNSILQKKVTLDFEKAAFTEILESIEKQTKVFFNYRTNILPKGNKYTVNFTDKTLETVLNSFKSKYKLDYAVISNKYIVLTKVTGRKTFTISGIVSEIGSKEKIIDAYVYDSLQNYVTRTNAQGYFSLTIPKDSIVLKVSRVGYKPFSIALNHNKDVRLNVTLSPVNTEKVVVKRNKKLNYLIGDETRINIRVVEKLPSLFGETDILKSLQLYPGVQSVSEGTSGILVRGGSPDQNLILLDGIPVYNASHLYGLYSIFNSDAVKKVSMSKGGFSVKNTGRLSSVIDIRTKDGNKEKLGVEGSLGLVSSKLLLEGPIKKGRTSFLVSGRRTYMDLFGAPLLAGFDDDVQDFVAGYYFYDVNGKVHHRINKNTYLSLIGYHGVDRTFIKNSFSLRTPENKIKEKDVQDLTWENNLWSLQLNKYISKKWYGNLSAVYSNYVINNNSTYEYTVKDGSRKKEDYFKYDYYTGIRDVSLMGNLEWKPNRKHDVGMGFAATWHNFNPGLTIFSSKIDGSKQKSISGSGDEDAGEATIYIEDDMKIAKGLFLRSGLNVTSFILSEKSYFGVQERLNMRFYLNRFLLFNATWSNSKQFIHFLPNSTIGLPTDIWLPSTENIAPENAQQVSAGVQYNRSRYSFGIEGYYKEVDNIIEYKDGVNFIGSSSDWESKIEVGRGKAYGVETRIGKEKGRATGWVSYTLAWSNRTFANINNGKTFPFRFDRRHDISAVFNYRFSDKKFLSVTWVYGSGNPITLPIARYAAYPVSNPVNDVFVYGERNGYRMKDFHKLDIVYNLKTKNRYGEGVWSFGLYNAYNRLNPFFITTGYNDDNERVYKQVSIFPVLPSINYKLKF